MRTLEDAEKAVLNRIVSRFLNLSQGTPIQRTRISLGPNRSMLDRLMQDGYLKTFRNDYLPTFPAVEQQDADIRNMGRTLVGAVLSALKNLFRRHERGDFKVEEIIAEVQSMGVVREMKEVVVGLILATDFDYFSGHAGPRIIEGRLSMHSVSVKENILDFESVEKSWQRLNAEREEVRQRLVARQTAHPNIVAPAPLEPAGGDFTFMRNPALKRIAERDYGELIEISNTRAWKARLVLTGCVLEAILLDALLSREAEARESCRRSERNKPLEGWSLETLISVAVKLEMIKKDAQRFTDSVRDYRNLIHPGREARGELRVGESQAKIAEEVLKIVVEDLRKS